MPSGPQFDEAAVEALLAGRTNDAVTGDPALAAFVDDVRTVADGPVPRPTAQLAALMAEGLSTEQGDLPATVPQVSARPKWRKRRMSVAQLLAGLAAKLAGMGLAAKAALGLGAAAMMTTTAAAAGVLPDPVQHAVASVVNPVSPLNVPDGTGAVAADEDDPDTSTTTSTPSTTLPGGDDDDDGTDDGEAGVPANHGGCVSEAAHSVNRGPGGEHGKAVSEVARSDCGKSGDDDDDETTVTTEPTTTPTTDGTSASSNSGPGSQNSGKGKGNGGNGGSGNGNSGSGSGNGNSGSGNGNSGSGGGGR
jgi:hypothetical protein